MAAGAIALSMDEDKDEDVEEEEDKDEEEDEDEDSATRSSFSEREMVDDQGWSDPVAMVSPTGSAWSLTMKGEDGDREVAEAVSEAPLRRVVPSTHEGETVEEAAERRALESEEVEMRVEPVYNMTELRGVFDQAGDKLVVVDIHSDSVCDTGLAEEADYQFKRYQKKIMAPCQSVKHVLMRTARNCPDVTFVSVVGDGDDEGKEVCRELGGVSIADLVFL